MNKIELINVFKIIHGNTVLSDINLSFEGGKIYGLQGINGSGKTMLMRIIIGLIHPTKGSIYINGKYIGRDVEFPENIGFMIENPSFLDRYTGMENLKMLASIQEKIKDKEIEDSIQAVGLDPYDKKKYRKYSLGMKQRLGIAAAVMEQPDIVILDEPTNALDEAGVELVKKIILEQKLRGAIVIIACHDRIILEELSDEIIKLETGRVLDATS